MHTNVVLKLGTRRSLLAWTQSSWVARQLEAMHPGLKVELVGMDTQGDHIQDKPLSQIEGKEFFTAELDRALLDQKVHLTVHSMKDLSLDRPAQITLAATPTREIPNDIILFHESVIQRIQEGKPVRVGTSSPRRLTLVPDFLKKALPRFSPKEPTIQFEEIRGNVNTRLSRVHEAEGTARKLDGVVLALAGLERLAQDDVASAELNQLLKHTLFMVLPLNECPTAPAQGALAIEARTDQPEVLKIIAALHDPKTLDDVKKEREILAQWGGGCHQKLGATYHRERLIIRGKKPSGEWIEEEKIDLSDFEKVTASDIFDFTRRELTPAETKQLADSSLIFVAHSRVLDFLNASTLVKKRLWVSGTRSWFKMAQAGLWVEGCLEGQGFESMKEMTTRKLLRLSEPFLFLTHLESAAHLKSEAVKSVPIGVYEHVFREIPAKIMNSQRIFWASSLTFEAIWSKMNALGKQEEFKNKTHACGPGRTADALRKKAIDPRIIVAQE